MKITEVQVRCSKCGWQGTVGNCEPDIDGDGSLGCPKCLALVRDHKRPWYGRKEK